MTDFKNKIDKITNAEQSKGVEKSRDRISKPWLKYYSSPIALRILAILEDGDLSQTKLASDLNVAPQQISKIVKGQENLTLETIYKLSTALNFDLITFPPYKYSNKQTSTSLYQIKIDSSSHLIDKGTLAGIYALLGAQKISSLESEPWKRGDEVMAIFYNQFSLI